MQPLRLPWLSALKRQNIQKGRGVVAPPGCTRAIPLRRTPDAAAGLARARCHCTILGLGAARLHPGAPTTRNESESLLTERTVAPRAFFRATTATVLVVRRPPSVQRAVAAQRLACRSATTPRRHVGHLGVVGGHTQPPGVTETDVWL